MFGRLTVLAMVALAAGCSGGETYKVVPVSGQVTMNGKPLPRAFVTFQPMGTPANPNPGAGSAATTDADGRFTLVMEGNRKGAVVGRHRVKICSALKGEMPVDVTGSKDGAGPLPEKETIPDRYHENSKLEFEVKADSPNDAVFALTSP